MTGTTTAQCPCGQPAPDATICRACTDRLAADLAAVPWLREQLDVALSRQTATGRQDGGRSADTPMPYDLGASDALEMLGTALTTWLPASPPVRYVGPRCSGFNFAYLLNRCAHESCRPALYPTGIDDMAGHMGARLDVARAHPGADGMLRDIGGAVAKARRTVDRRPDRWFAGPCDGQGYTARPVDAPDLGCGEWLYARPEARDVRCRACSTSYDVPTRRAWMLEAAEDYLCHASLIAAAVTRLGEPVKPGRIRLWAHRGRIEQRGTDAQSRPLYRVGDVLDLLHGEASRFVPQTVIDNSTNR